MSLEKGSVARLGLLIWLLVSAVIGLQTWVGNETIYAPALEAKREALHFAVLHNKAPGDGSWGALGALSIEKCVGVVYLAEGIRQLAGSPVGRICQILDTLFLVLYLLALFFYLKRCLK